MQVILKVVGGKNDGRQIKIAVPRFIIGRGETAHLRPASDLISREHCEIVVGDGVVRVSDLKSRNGTYINGLKLDGTHDVSSGDSLRVGRLQFEIVVDHAIAGAKKPKVKGVVEAASRAATAKKKPSLEDSISDWLMDDDDDDPSTDERDEIASAETLQLNLEDTSVFGKGKAVRDEMRRREKEEKEAKEAEEASGSAKSKGKGKAKPMKLPKLPQNEDAKHGNSTSAADDVLKKFFKRR